ncbi:MAG TPA: efflux RND transporter permease subunit [Chthonomonadaceae bacterium]|nr:efflux RND transporter permease subunit [Chthonomonadaceae bacterium]
MWLVRLALHRPRMVAVIAILIFILGTLNILRMPKDIFPKINVPVVAVIWTYGGLAPEEVDKRVLLLSEQAISTTVSNVEHIETQSLPGTGIIKVFLQPGSKVSEAITQISSTSQAVIQHMPQGITPPNIIDYDASDVPIVQLALSSETLPITAVNDLAGTVVFPQLITVKGGAFSPPAGGMPRLINVDLDTDAMTAKGISAQDIAAAIGKQNLILPAGDAKMGKRDYIVRLNNSPPNVDDFNNLPIKVVNGATIFVRDVAHVRNGNGIQVSLVRVNSKPAVIITILKNSAASTLDVVEGVKAKLPMVRSLLPADVKLDLLLDQSVFVREVISGVIREAVIAAALTGLMILLFLGSWRSTLVVAISIPLSILASIVMLGLFGQTLNTLTLGGLSMAVGMLVDDATVEVENTTRNLGLGYRLHRAILHSAQQVALPALTSMLSICIVFIPVAFLTGVAASLFIPLALAVVFAMIPSYMLSRSLVTTMMEHLLGKELDLYQQPETSNSPSRRNIIWKIHAKFEVVFEKIRDVYHRQLVAAMKHRGVAICLIVLFFALSAILLPFIGEDFFPIVDSGQMRLHVRVSPGTRLEETGRRFSEIEATIRQVLPEKEVALILDNIGLSNGTSYVRGSSGTISSADGEIDISLTPKHHPTFDYMAKIRERLVKDYPDCTFYYQPADIETQVLDFGTSAPIDVQVMGAYENQAKNYELAQEIQRRAGLVAGVQDTYIYQVYKAPEIRLDVDRSRALLMGLTQSDTAGNVLVSLSSSTRVAPTYFLDRKTGNSYTVSTQTKQYKIDSIEALLATPIFTPNAAKRQTTPQFLNNLATVSRDNTPAVVSEYQILPVFDVFASVENRDLGSASNDINKIIKDIQKQAPRGTVIELNGQARTMQTSFTQMGLGLIFAIVLIYLLLTVNFESWVDPLIILMASPGALCGVLWGLFTSRTTFNVPSLMGTIMSIGVATANSILLVTFANEQRLEGKSALEAALAAGYTRFRPVIMTALAMILGMLPMSLGLGEGGEQNAPLGRAVIGGLVVATCTTLFFVPIMYTLLRRNYTPRVDIEDRPDVTS